MSGTIPRLLCACIVLGYVLATTGEARADGPADAAQIEAARKHYDAGLQLTKDEAYDAAVAEFERAYQIAPNYRILYNIGGLRRQLNDFAGALRAFERYLTDGAGAIPADRAREVQEEIAVLRRRVGRIAVAVDTAGADVTVDDVPVGRSPLAAPLVVNPGRRKVGATKAGMLPAASVVLVAGGETAHTELKLTSLASATAAQGATPAPAAERPEGADAPASTAPTTSSAPVIVAWGVTAGLAVGAATAGIAALNAADDLRRERTSMTPSRAKLDEEQSRTETLALVSDVFTIGTVVAAGAAVYFTVRALSREPVTVAMRPSAITVRATW